MTFRFSRAIGAFLCASLLLAACGDDDDAATGDTTSSTDPTDSGDAHDHGAGHEVDPAPSLSIDVEPDAKSGANLHVEVTDLVFAPLAASTDHVAGEGHAHVYIDGEKIGRLYTDWFHIDPLEPGEHEVRVELNGNDHAPLLSGGSPIEATTTLTIAEPEAGHSHGDIAGHELSAPATVALTLTPDAKDGWNVTLETTGFAFTPESVNEDHVDAEGHAHLYVGDTKISRLYGPAFHLPASKVPEGEQVVRVELNGNDHLPLLVDGSPVEATQSVTGTATAADSDMDDHDTGDLESDDDHAHSGDGETLDTDVADTTIEVAYVGGSVDGADRYEVALGSTVLLIVTSDVADDIHVHGYDILRDIDANETVEFAFEADLPGVWEIELEGAGVQLVELAVS